MKAKMLVLIGLVVGQVALAGYPCPPMECDNGSQCGAGLPPCPSPHPRQSCPSKAGPRACWAQPEGAECEAMGPHGGKMPGECRLLPEGDRCGCFGVF